MTLAGRELVIEHGKFAFQAHGAATVSLGETVILATATMSENPREGMDFFPMMVDFEERYYASGKIKGSRFIKREGRPSDKAILTARLTDRTLRPLFPKGMVNDVQIIATAFSVDLEVDPATTAINAASSALMVSGMPFEGPVGAVRMGLVTDAEGKETLVVNPTYEQCEKGRLNLIVAGTKDAITMVEAGAKEVTEEKILEALEIAHQEIKKICELQLALHTAVKPADRKYIIHLPDEKAVEEVSAFITDADCEGLYAKEKPVVYEKIHALTEKVLENFKAKIESNEWKKSDVKASVDKRFKSYMRKNILEKEIRLDGRKIDEIRPIKCETSVFPRTHGSGLFQRGETQVITLTTLGSPGKAQTIDTMDTDETRRYIHHYNFPPFSTGEVKMMRGTGRREIGHGDLAERALLAVLPDNETFPYTMRLVSETLSCNGSSSMGSVCGSTLSLMDAGVPIIAPVSGIAMGLVMGKDGNYKILSDIQGMEDFAGDMDFKAAGTEQGITALQMDIKVKGLTHALLNEALSKAKVGRAIILAAMMATISEPRKELSKHAPLITSLRIDPEQIRSVIGKGGETIRDITETFGVEIDIEDDGLVFITAPNQESGQKALERVKQITYKPNVGDTFDGTVVRIMDFGAFVEFIPGKDGLVHVSELANSFVKNPNDVVKLGDKLRVKLMKVDDQGRYNLSHKATLSKDESSGESNKRAR